MSGTVNISRDIWNDAAFKLQPFTEREAFMWMIMEASWKPREKRVGSAVVSLERGQLAASVRFMAEAWSWKKSTVSRFLKRLENRDMIGTVSGTGLSVITICKYDEYQSAPRNGGTAEKPKAGQQRDSSGTNENKGERKVEEGQEEPNGSLSADAAAPVHSSPASEAVAAYNASAERAGWPKVQRMTPARARSLKARLAECGGIEGWEVALKRALDSDFLCARTPNPWTGFGFDWLVKAANFTKIMEGNYDNRTSGTNGSPTPYGRGMAGSATAAEIADRGARWAASRAARR